MQKKKSVAVNITMSSYLRQEIVDRADDESRSVGSLIRHACEIYLKKPKEKI